MVLKTCVSFLQWVEVPTALQRPGPCSPSRVSKKCRDFDFPGEQSTALVLREVCCFLSLRPSQECISFLGSQSGSAPGAQRTGFLFHMVGFASLPIFQGLGTILTYLAVCSSVSGWGCCLSPFNRGASLLSSGRG